MFWDEESKTRQRIVIETDYVKIKVFNWEKFTLFVIFSLMLIIFLGRKHQATNSRDDYQNNHQDHTEEVYQQFEEIQ